MHVDNMDLKETIYKRQSIRKYDEAESAEIEID